MDKTKDVKELRDRRASLGETTFYKIFALISILLFAFFLLDLSLSYVSVHNTVTGQCSLQPVIKFIPLLG